jgi:hypothetical protein
MNRFIIVGTERTGSSVFAESLGRHERIACGWEWTSRSPWWAKLTIAQRALKGDFAALAEKHQQFMRTAVNERTEWLGFRRLFGSSDKWLGHPATSLSLVRSRFRAHLSWLCSEPDIRVLHIVRNDNLDWIKSKFVAKSASSYIGSAYPEDLKVDVPVGEAVKRLTSKRYVDHRLAGLAATNPYLQVTYEAISAGLDAETTRAWQFLDCDPGQFAAADVTIERQSTKSAQEYIRNYGHLHDALVRTGFL